jgi:hypothetical protein
MNQVTRMTAGRAIPDRMAPGAGSDSLLVDSAISHAEKLRRVLELEEWINNVTPDDPLLLTTSRKWRAEREQLLAELRLEDQAAAAPVRPDFAAPRPGRLSNSWLQRLLRRLRPEEDAD